MFLHADKLRFDTGDVWAVYNDPDDGEESERPLSDFSSVEEICQWVDDIEKLSENEKEG